MAISNMHSKTTGQVITKYFEEPPGAEKTKSTKSSYHMTNLATMP